MVTLGGFVFPEQRTFVRVRTREVLSRVRKEIEIYSLLIHYASLEGLRGDLEALEGELEKLDRGEVSLSIHEGRYFMGRRRDLQRFVEPRHLAATIHLLVLTEDRFERSVEEHQETLALSESGQAMVVSQAGSGLAFARFLLTAGGTLVKPRISDGTRSVVFEASLESGETLELDGDARTAKRNSSENVLHLVSGEFPLLSPGDTTITYTDDEASSHTGTLEVRYRDLWV